MFRHLKIALFSFSLVGLGGCSTLSDSMDYVGNSIVSASEATVQFTSDVKVEALEDKQFALAQTFNEPVRSLDSWAMRIEAREACPEGYVYLNRNAVKSAGFGIVDSECVGTGSCSYELQWRIKCQDVPDEPFSLFGKT